jgi:Anti-sigma-K factor rskA, C-terminal
MTTQPPEPGERELFDELEAVLPRVSPPADLFERVLDEVRGDAVVVPLRRRRARGPRAVGALATAAAVIVAVGAWAALRNGPDTSPARAVLVGTGVSGEAEVVGARIHVSLHEVPPPPAEHHYEVWVLRPGAEAMEPIGAFTTSGPDVDLVFAVSGTGPYAAVDVSVEEDDGPDDHSGTSLATGSFD